ncbi:TPA: hypothetical protein ACT5B7_006673 [Burkholderia cenocepacia]
MKKQKPANERAFCVINSTAGDDMATREEVERAIEGELARRSQKVLNRNAISALFGAISDPVAALGKVFLGRQDALDTERARIEQGIILDLVVKIDDALTQALKQAAVHKVSVGGTFEANVYGGGVGTAMHIAGDAPPVEFQPDTKVVVNVHSGSGTALQIGGGLNISPGRVHTGGSEPPEK